MKKSRVFLVLLVLLVTLLAGCANQNGEGAAIADIRQLDGQTVGVMTGSTFDRRADTYINDAKKEYYTTYADMALAVEQGKGRRTSHRIHHGPGAVRREPGGDLSGGLPDGGWLRLLPFQD